VTVFLTGATGFIGRTLAVRLAREGHRVRCLVRTPAKAAWMREHPSLEPVHGDLEDGALLRTAAAGAEVIFHLAGCTSAVRKETLFAVNGDATGRLAEAASAAASPSARLVYVSSLAAAGPHTADRPAREESPPRPVSEYGRSKLLGEELLRRHCSGLSWTIIRPPAVYGPFDRDVLFLFKMARRGILLRVRGVNTETSLIHVDDLVEALVLAAFHPGAAGKHYYVSDGNVYNAGEIAATLRSLTGRGVNLPLPVSAMKLAGRFCDLAGLVTGRPLLLNSDKVTETLQPGWVCSSGKIRREIGFTPRIAMAEGFASTYRWYRSHGWI
jgi:nucleoside-diphosphate-sugar epimerase